MRNPPIAISALIFGVSAFACDVGSSSEMPGSSSSGGVTNATSGGSTAKGGVTSSGGSMSTMGGSGGAAGNAGNAGGGSAGTSAGAANAGSAGGGAANAGSTGGGGANVGGNNGACGSALYCDDFESYTVGQAPGAPFKTQTNSGTVTIDDTQHVSGSKSVKFTTEASSSSKTAYLRLEGSPVFPVTGNAFYGRMMFRLESAPTESVHWTFIEGGGLIPGQTYHALYRYGGQMPITDGSNFVGSQMMANYETPDSYSGNGPSSDCWNHANMHVVPVGKWSCVEWKFDGSKNEMRLWLDGAAQDDLTVSGTGQGCVNQPNDYAWTAPNFDHIEVGWESYQMDDARTLYVDDLVISTTPIGCPQ